MELEITPEPSPEEREVLEQALTRLLAADSAAEPSAWWRAGLEEALSRDEEPV
jgi:hypothetical protein